MQKALQNMECDVCTLLDIMKGKNTYCQYYRNISRKLHDINWLKTRQHEPQS